MSYTEKTLAIRHFSREYFRDFGKKFPERNFIDQEEIRKTRKKSLNNREYIVVSPASFPYNIIRRLSARHPGYFAAQIHFEISRYLCRVSLGQLTFNQWRHGMRERERQKKKKKEKLSRAQT